MATVPKLGIIQPSQPAPLRPEDILKPEHLAERLQVPLSWVYKKSAERGSRSMPVLRCGHYLRFSWPDVCAWMRSENKG
jgi:hypothetical protein